MTLTEDRIKFVDKPDPCYKAFEALSRAELVGVDVQWRPETGLAPSLVSLLQVATRDVVYLFDVMTLKGTAKDKLADGFKKLLANPEVGKLGQF